MQDVKTYFVLASLVWVWTANMSDILLKKVAGLSYKPRNGFAGYIFTHKPFNCGMCLSFWIGILFTMLTFNILFLSLPVTYKLINKIL